MREYIMHLISTAVLTAILLSFFDKRSTQHELLKCVCGIVMVIAAISPLVHFNGMNLDRYIEDFSAEGQSAIEDGLDNAEELLRKRIKESCEAYILDKAASLGATILADVELDETDPPKPYRVTIIGSVSPFVKRQLTHYLKTEFQIPEEMQIWNQ